VQQHSAGLFLFYRSLGRFTVYKANLFAQLFPYLPQNQPTVATPATVDGDGTSQPIPAQPAPIALAPVADENGNSLPVGQPDLTGFDPGSMGPSVWTGVQATPQPADQPAIPGGGYVEPTASPAAMTMMPAIQNDSTDTTGRHAAFTSDQPQMPDYSNLPPEERAYREAVWNSQHAENKDHGLKGHLGQILSNFLYSMGQAYAANPMIDAKALLAVGGVGAGAGQLQPAWNERRMAAAQIPVLRQVADAASAQRMKDAQAHLYEARPGMEANKEAGKDTRSLIAHMTQQYKAQPSFDDSDPDDKAFNDAYEKIAGYRLPNRDAKTKSDQFIDQRDGQVWLRQTDATGHYKYVKVLNNDGSPLTVETKEMRTSGDREAQRQLEKETADNRNVTSIKVANINAASRKYSADTSASTSRYSTDARTQLATITDLNKLSQTRATILAMTPNKGENADAFKQRQQNALGAIDTRIAELQPK
jgi:hypothetical protein